MKLTESIELYVREPSGRFRAAAPIEVCETAADIIYRRSMLQRDVMKSSDVSRAFLRNRLAWREHEVFAVLMLDNKHRVIDFVELFRGTLDGASVHAREVVKEVLKANAAAVILSHNHPSGSAEPSEADRRVTERLRDALEIVDVRVLDHIVVGLEEVTSFSDRGLL